MFKSNRIFVVVSRGGKVARFAYDPKKVRTSKRELVGETDMASNVAVLQTVNYTLGQLIEKGFTGRVSFVVNDDVAIRAFEYRKAAKAGDDTVSALQKEWMDDDYLAAIEEFCGAMECLSDSIEFNFVKLSNVRHWALSIADSVELEVGMKLNFVDGSAMDGLVQCEVNSLNGEYEVVKYNGVFCLPRRANSIDMINLRKVVDYVFTLVPEEEIELGEESITAGEDF